MTNLMKVVAVAAILGCFFVPTAASAQSDNGCMSVTLLIQGKLQPFYGWNGPVRGLLVDQNKKVWPLQGKLDRPPFTGLPVQTVYTGQVGHETFPFAFDFGAAGKFAGLIDHEIAWFSPSITPHFEFDPQNPPPFALGTTKSTFKVVPQTVVGWASSGWFEKATGNLSAAATFLVNSVPVPDPDPPGAGPVVGWWNVEITGKLCNVEIK